MADADEVLEAVSDRLPTPQDEDCVFVAVDGVDGSGKTTFADRLSVRLSAVGTPSIRIMLDDFLNPSEIRYERGRHSPAGFFLDSYDYRRFTADVLVPLGPGGSRSYRPRSYDRDSDRVIAVDPVAAAPGSIVVIDGMFLHRDELFERWDFSIFLDVPFAETARRMSIRNGSNPDPEHPSMRRYVEGQRIYLSTCRPQERANLVIDNSDVARPIIVENASPR